jgi:predicted 3-demethylubiquinone-9 3-methyltransferase (glyoxalase superfamily)
MTSTDRVDLIPNRSDPMPRTVPCLWFDTQAEEAATFYTSVFPNSEITEVVRYTDAGPRPADMVMVVSFVLDGQEYTALNGGPQFTFGEAVSFQVMCDSQTEIDRYWQALSDGGEEGPCGWLKDRFGLSWQVVPTALTELLSAADPERSRRATEAMLRMQRIDIAEVLRAADGATTSG